MKSKGKCSVRGCRNDSTIIRLGQEYCDACYNKLCAEDEAVRDDQSIRDAEARAESAMFERRH